VPTKAKISAEGRQQRREVEVSFWASVLGFGFGLGFGFSFGCLPFFLFSVLLLSRFMHV